MAYTPTKHREYGSTKALVARLIDDAGGAKQAAFIVERASSQVYAYADPDVDAQISLDMARRLTVSTGSKALAEDFAALAGGVFMPIVPPNAETLESLAATKAHEHGRMISSLFIAMADNHVSGDEARKLLVEADSNLRVLVAMRARLATIAEGK